MSYEKQTWQTGDVVTSAKLNHMEDGIAAGGALVVTATLEDAGFVCEKTAGEMWAAINGGKNIIISMPDSCVWPVIYADAGFNFADAGFNFYVWNGDSAMAFTAASADDYPTAVD